MKLTMEYEWCIGRAKGKQAAKIMELAGSNAGYFIRNTSGKGLGLEVEYAFTRAIDSPTPDHLAKADFMQIEKLEKMRQTRSGIKEEHEVVDNKV